MKKAGQTVVRLNICAAEKMFQFADDRVLLFVNVLIKKNAVWKYTADNFLHSLNLLVVDALRHNYARRRVRSDRRFWNNYIFFFNLKWFYGFFAAPKLQEIGPSAFDSPFSAALRSGASRLNIFWNEIELSCFCASWDELEWACSV